MAGSTHVVVIGGGYAGVMAANRLTQREDVAVTLVNPRSEFVHRVRLHQLVGGSDAAVVAYEDVLAQGVRLVVDAVDVIDAAGRRVRLSDGSALGYDYLVYAVGSGSAEPDVPGAAEFAFPIATLETAQRLRSVLADTALAAPVTVVGAGPTGIETAAELAELGRRVTLVCGGVLGPYLHARGRRAVARRLAALGVTVVEGGDAKVTAVTRDAVRLADGRELASAVTVWTVGFAVPDLALRSGLTTDTAGRLLTDETLTSVDDERVVAAGDAMAPSGLALRMSCLNAIPTGARAADTVLSRLAGEQPELLHQGFYAQCISLGRAAGIFQLATRSDVAVGVHVGGSLGAKVKESICKGIPDHLADEGRKPGSYRLHRLRGGAEKRRRLLDAHRAELQEPAEQRV
ncbi:NAD(P)/FAD-dependent oxidoreductase [Lentzea chajnantorensis]